MSVATITRSKREADFLVKFRPDELADLHPELYAAITREARRIVACEERARRVERSIARARRDIEGGTFPASPFKGYRYRDPLGEWQRRPDYLSTSLHEPVVCAWLIDLCANADGLAPLDSVKAQARKLHDEESDYAWNHISAATLIGALRSVGSCGIVERPYPRTWRVTDLGRELLDLVFVA